MPLTGSSRAIAVVVLATSLAASTLVAARDGTPRWTADGDWAEGHLPPSALRHRHRHDAQFRRARAYAPPPELIHAYLPRYTERPMYNEPPNHFPQR